MLRKERGEIIAAVQLECSTLFSDIDELEKRRLKQAGDQRDLQLANLRADFEVEVQQAWNEFERGKRALRSEILASSVERRRRLEAIRTGAVAKKKRRGRSGVERSFRLKSHVRQPFLCELERQGMVRVALTPDEVNNDLAIILNGVDSAKANSASKGIVERAVDGSTKVIDKIHSSRGILHYHDVTYEKGDRVSILGHGRLGSSKHVLRYAGVLLSVNSKEIQVRSDDGMYFSKRSMTL